MKKGCRVKALLLIICMLATLFSPFDAKTASAAGSVRLRDMVAKENFTYTGTLPKYKINGTDFDLSGTPAIVNSTGAALCNVRVFTEGVGLTYSYRSKKKEITFSNGSKELIMYVGSKTGYLNGKEITLASCPVRYKYRDTGETCILVPSRFVAETFGCKYVWTQSNETASITVPLKLNYDGQDTTYSGTMGQIYIDGKKIKLGKYPSITIAENAMVRASKVFGEGLDAEYSYNSSTGEIIIKNDVNTIEMQLGSRVAYVNGIARVADVAPKMIKFLDYGKKYVYVPGRFTAENLGYGYTWSDSLSASKITIPAVIAKTPLNETLIFSSDRIEWDYSKRRVYDDFDTSVITSKQVIAEPVFFPLPDGITAEDVKISQDYYDMQTTIKIPGDYTEFYKDRIIKMTDTYMDRIIVTLGPKEDLSEEETSQPEGTDDSTIENEKIWYDEKNRPMVIRYDENGTPYYVYVDDLNKSGSINAPKEKTPASDAELPECTTIITLQCKKFLEYCIDEDAIEPGNGITIAFARPEDIYDNILILDAGHGDYDPGTTHGGYKEKDVNFLMTNTHLKKLFAGTNVKVYFTREKDVLIPLYKRAMLADIIGADLFVSIHHNSSGNTKAKGTSIYYSSVDTGTYGNITSKSLARKLQNALLDKLGTEDRGIIDYPFVVVRSNTVPAVLIEIGFMSNKSELKKIVKTSFQKKAANAIFDTLTGIFNTKGYEQ